MTSLEPDTTEDTPAVQEPRIKPSSVTLPKGGGAIQGLGETFSANAFTGAATLVLPIALTACKGSSPALSLQYQSAAGNGIFGLGFNVDIPAIACRTSTGQPLYDGTDTYVLPDGTPLVIDSSTPSREQDGLIIKRYLPCHEGGFALIEQWINTLTQSSFWRIIDASNVQSHFGRTADARIADPSQPEHIFSWLLEDRITAHGDATLYTYQAENTANIATAIYEQGRVQTTNRYPERILYGNDTPVFSIEDLATTEWHFEVVFDYGQYTLDPLPPQPYLPPAHAQWTARQDPFSTYTAGFEIRTHRLCQHILMFHRFKELGDEPVLVRLTRFTYDQNPVASRLIMVEAEGCQSTVQDYTSQALPPLEFGYTHFAPQSGRFEALRRSDEVPAPLVGSAPWYRFVDLQGQGLPGILFQSQSTVLYMAPQGPCKHIDTDDNSDEVILYTPPVAPATFPSLGLNGSSTLLDITGCGRPAWVAVSADGSRYAQALANGGWAPFEVLPAVPRDLLSPHSLMADLTGDGLNDVVYLDDQSVRIYPSLGTQGYGPALVRPRDDGVPLTTQDSSCVVLQMTDMFGSGREHLVRIANGSVEVWPSLGFGRFGSRVQLGNAPQFGEDFSIERLFLADIDGSGTVDLLYVHPDHIDLYMNHSGNAFAEAIAIPLPNTWGPGSKIQFADVRGNGSAALVFSDAHLPGPLAYDFGSRSKPYLLNRVDNNMGASTHISYQPSTTYALRDRRDGRPWVTELPFPVQVVDRIDAIDSVSQTRLVSTYNYRHGYYDPIERQFCGFGQVDHTDTQSREEYLRSSSGTAEIHTPASLTRTWYHTGAWMDGSLCDAFVNDYFAADASAPRVMPARFQWLGEPSTESVRQAHLALKGLQLRQEIYGLDSTDAQSTPYHVVENGYDVRQIQRPLDKQHAVFFAYPLQTLSLHYERNPADPRITQDMTLQVDDYGSVLRRASIAYPRRADIATRLPEQSQCFVTSNTNQYVDLTGNDVRLLGQPVESYNWLLRAPPPPSSGQTYTVEELAHLIDTALADPEADLTLFGRYRSYYWSPETKTALPLGQTSAQGLLCQQWTALATPTDLQTAYDGVLSATDLTQLLAQNGKYIENDGLWWNPGLLQTFLDTDHYYLPSSIIDPFGATQTLEYDPYDLVLVRSEDALGNVINVTSIDYRTLAPWEITDPNQTVSQTLCDALGMVCATSLRGMQGKQPVGFKSLSLDRREQPFDLETALSQPQTYLQGAATYTAYDLFSWCGRITPQALSGLDDTSSNVWESLVGQHYISRSGAMLKRWRERPLGAPLQLPGLSPQVASAVGARLAMVPSQVPVHATTLQAETYELTGRVQYSIQYSDGFNRLVQCQALVDPGPSWQVNANHSVTSTHSIERWVVSGATVYDNKGNPIRQYEPVYSAGRGYISNEELSRFGVSPLIRYDPLNRKIRVDTPKGFFTKTLFCPWSEHLFDTNDTVLDSDYYRTHIDDPTLDPRERTALQQAAVFFNTPTVRQFNALGQAIRVTKLLAPQATNQRLEDAGLTMFNYFDIQGQLLDSADDRMLTQGLKNIRVIFTLDGQKIKSTCVDSGTRWVINNVSGKPIWGTDSRGAIQTSRYDLLGRLLEVQVIEAHEPERRTVRKIQYGESVPDAQGLNLRGQPYTLFDSAGLEVNLAYSIQGQLLSQTRQLAIDFSREADWKQLDDTQKFQTDWTYDALNRVETQALRRLNDVSAERVSYTYARTGLVSQVSLTPADTGIAQVYVDSITYDAKGQRQQITYANGVTTRYTYEPSTFRLQALVSQHTLDSRTLQALSYVYDPVGNITSIDDASQQVVFNANQRVDPQSNYTYDATYRLISASGREHPGVSDGGNDFIPLSALNDGRALQNYTRTYSYDLSGNLLRIQHQAAISTNRAVTISTTSNHGVDATLTTDPTRVDEFFDAAGNQIRWAGLSGAQWSYTDRLANITLVTRSNGTNDTSFYVYDANGVRLRKVTRTFGSAGATEMLDDTVYINGLEIRRRLINNILTQEYRTIRVMDGERCLAQRLVWTVGSPGDGVASPQLRYQLENYLGSAVMELDSSGKIITYEEYFPYGGTSFIAGDNATDVQLKRYRYAGKERDEVTGLYYFGARYYQPSIGRWLSADPSGPDDGLNLYCYVGDNPIIFSDPNGMLRVLVAGEGKDFSYSTALAKKYPDATIMVTQYDITPRPENGPANLHYYPNQLDVTSPDSWAALADWAQDNADGDRFDTLVFNNPHAGYGLSKFQVMGIDAGFKELPASPSYEHSRALGQQDVAGATPQITDMSSLKTLDLSDVFVPTGGVKYIASKSVMGMNESILNGFFNLGRSVTEPTGTLIAFLPNGSRNEKLVTDFKGGKRPPAGEGTFSAKQFSEDAAYNDHALGVNYNSNLTATQPHASWGPNFTPGPPKLGSMKSHQYKRSNSPTPGLNRRPRVDSSVSSPHSGSERARSPERH
ncbi:Insecticide toxin TcdB middle/N-terminal region [Pseudomonas gessardii]|uniref:Toxin n=1 Tax=Pseudomonas gessardii TaxID=78544 RepID=A0A7Y1MKJ2_9PSED|nr:SpvB/TcaC N-terminal domain-containing protein [Pseudomonas gessardii]MRU49474.1 toxin [Pseudomonas gessardii]NNA93863.1 toxin [Pseudomonas gessardii]ONH47768.1 toxin [Pseudomonas gessardii]SDR40021.1 Insecticide toxin TcdB middle/N-terminal region [Pseudomonas gessardii]